MDVAVPIDFSNDYFEVDCMNFHLSPNSSSSTSSSASTNSACIDDDDDNTILDSLIAMDCSPETEAIEDNDDSNFLNNNEELNEIISILNQLDRCTAQLGGNQHLSETVLRMATRIYSYVDCSSFLNVTASSSMSQTSCYYPAQMQNDTFILQNTCIGQSNDFESMTLPLLLSRLVFASNKIYGDEYDGHSFGISLLRYMEVLIQRITKKQCKISPESIHKVCIGTFVLAIKVLQDNVPDAMTLEYICCLDIEKISIIEREICKILDFHLIVSPEELNLQAI